VIRDLLEFAVAAGHAAVVDVEDSESVLGEKLVEEEPLLTPLVARGIHAGAAVGIDDERNAVRSRLAGRKEKRAVEFGGLVSGGEHQRLGSDERVAFNRLRTPEGGAGASGGAGGDDRRDEFLGPGVDEVAALRGKAGIVKAGVLGDGALAAAVELDGPDLLLA